MTDDLSNVMPQQRLALPLPRGRGKPQTSGNPLNKPMDISDPTPEDKESVHPTYSLTLKGKQRLMVLSLGHATTRI